MAKKKYYAVKKGKHTGIFHSWEECKASVDGYPGAEYRGFATKAEAETYIIGTGNFVHGRQRSVSDGDALDENSQAESKGEPGQVVAYVDGSFDEKIGKYAFGCVILTPEGETIRRFGNGDNPQSMALRNVTEEMLGAMYAVKWCDKYGYSAIEICYDYMGIEMWATGGWRAKNELTQKYASFMKEHGRKLNISFCKIAAHTGDKYNEEADQLAKTGLVEGKGIPEI